MLVLERGMTGNAEGASGRIAGYVCLSCWPSRSKYSGWCATRASVLTDGLLERGASESPKCVPGHRATRRALCGPSGSLRTRSYLCGTARSRERIRRWSAPRTRPLRSTARKRQVTMPQLVGTDTVPDATAVHRTVWPVGARSASAPGLQAYREIVDRRGDTMALDADP